MDHIINETDAYFQHYQRTHVFLRALEGLTTSFGWIGFLLHSPSRVDFLHIIYFFNTFFSLCFHLFPDARTIQMDKKMIDLLIGFELSHVYANNFILPILWMMEPSSTSGQQKLRIARVIIGSITVYKTHNDLQLIQSAFFMVLFYVCGAFGRLNYLNIAAIFHCLFHVAYGFQVYYLSRHFKSPSKIHWVGLVLFYVYKFSQILDTTADKILDGQKNYQK